MTSTNYTPLSDEDRKVFAYLGEVIRENVELRLKVERQDGWLDRIEAMHRSWGSAGGDAAKAEETVLGVWLEMKSLMEARARWEARS